MNTKNELKTFVREHVGPNASDIFLNRALSRIENAGDDRDSLLEAAEGVARMITLFIDENQGHQVLENLKLLIGEKNS